MNKLTKEEALEILDTIPTIHEQVDALEMAIEALKNQRTGHWILADEQNEADVKNDNYRYICSVCGRSDIHSKFVTVPHCWFCGAKMEGE